MPVSYSDACAAILDDPAPLLYLDTCVLLDIVRAPIRESIDSTSARIACELKARSETTPRGLWLVTSETVQLEWAVNSSDIVAEVEREILRLEARRKHFLAAATAISNVAYEHGQREGSLGLSEQLEAAASSLLNACLIIQPNDTHMVGAMNRVKRNLAPARRGKSEPKDCEIYELFLCLCRYLRSNGFSGPCVFSSSNTNEYGAINSGGVQPELDSVNGKFVSNYPWMKAVIDGRA